jgi:capsular exopolysaccharide synthesis family protein
MTHQNPAPDPSGYRPPAHEVQEVHLRDYLFLVLKRRWLVAAVMATVVGVTLIGSLLQTSTYKATTLVQVDRGKINLVQDVMVEDVRAGNEEFYATQQRVFKSRTLAYRIMEHGDLWEHPALRVETPFWKKDASVDREEQIDKLLSNLEVSSLRKTQLLEVSFVTSDAKLSAQLANSLVDEYVAFNGEAETGVAKNTASFIREQVGKLQAEIQQKEKLLREYSQRQDIVMVDKKENIVIQQLEDLNRQLSAVRGQRAAAEARYRSLWAADAGSIGEVNRDSTVRELKQEYLSMKKQHAELSTKFKSDWPEMQRLRSAMEDVKERLDLEIQEGARRVVAAARMEYEAAQKQEALLRETLEKQKREAQGLNKLASDYNSIKVELDNQRTMLQQLLRRQSETGLSAELGERQPVNVRVVEQAVIPTDRYRPSVGRNLTLAVVLGLFLAGGLAYFLDYWDTSIYGVEDLRRNLSVPYLGMVPRCVAVDSGAKRQKQVTPRASPRPGSASARGGESESHLPVLRGSETLAARGQSVIGEQFRFLRGSLMLSSPGAPPKVVLVTSAEKGAGKTFVTCNLATSLAELGKKVLLVDADLRNPSLHRVFRMFNRVGLSSVLTGQKSVDEGCVLRTDIANVYVLLAGPLSPSPAELLSSSAMDHALARCSEHFDFVLVDSAPLLPVIDISWFVADKHHAMQSRTVSIWWSGFAEE